MLDILKKVFSSEGKEKDPVCGMNVDPKTALHAVRGGKQYFFCSDHCRSKFEVQPDQSTTQKIVTVAHVVIKTI